MARSCGPSCASRTQVRPARLSSCRLELTVCAGSGLAKFVLINWLGEGVPESKKGLFPSHSAAVAKFLKGCVYSGSWTGMQADAHQQIPRCDPSSF